LPAFSGVVWSESPLTATASMLSSTKVRFRPEAAVHHKKLLVKRNGRHSSGNMVFLGVKNFHWRLLLGEVLHVDEAYQRKSNLIMPLFEYKVQ
jgi:hypothetical protein